MKASMDTGACYGVKKCAEIAFKKGKMIRGEGLTVLEEKMEAQIQTKMKYIRSLDVNRQIKLT